jgi:predicted dehydrogenase
VARSAERSGAVRVTDTGPASAGAAVINAIGAGHYASAVLLPAFAAAGAGLRRVVSSSGLSATTQARRLGFAEASSDTEAALVDREANAVVISTRHDTHADLTVRALRAGKHVFVEKPLALSAAEIDRIEDCVAGLENPPLLMVGFNRRFAPHVVRMKEAIDAVDAPKSFVYTVNAGAIPMDNWIQDRDVGGGRVIGECCHFIDLLRHLAGAPVSEAGILAMASEARDSVVISLSFADGSIGSIQYLANGHRGFPKERLEVFQAGRVLQLDNFRKLTGHGLRLGGGFGAFRQDKGQERCARAFVDAIGFGRPSPIPFSELIEVARVTVGLAETA